MSAVSMYLDLECPTCRKALSLIKEKGREINMIEYIKSPPSRSQIRVLLSALGMTARELLRPKAQVYEQLGLANEQWTEDEIIGLMTEHPELISRPIIITAKGAKLCRPAEKVLDIL